MIWHHKEIDSNSPARNRWDSLLSYFVTYVPRWASLCHSSLSAFYDFSFKEPPLKFIIGIITPFLIFLCPVCISLLSKVPFFYSLFFFFNQNFYHWNFVLPTGNEFSLKVKFCMVSLSLTSAICCKLYYKSVTIFNVLFPLSLNLLSFNGGHLQIFIIP